MGQLLATQARVWDATTISSALSDEEVLTTDSHKTTEESERPSLGGEQRPPSILEKAGTHRLAWSCDGSRSASASDR